MFSLLVSLPGWAQQEGLEPEDPPLEVNPCEYIRPLNVTHNFITPTSLPCIGNIIDPDLGPLPQALDRYQLSITDGLSANGYNIISDKGITVILAPNPPGGNQQVSQFYSYTYNITFLEGGWHNIRILPIVPTPTRGTPNILCEELKVVKVPVLCSCPSQAYTVLGDPDEKTIIRSQNLNAVGNGINYVIGDLEFNSRFGNLNLINKKFIVLGNNSYFHNAPGGEVYGPTIKFTSKNPINNLPTSNQRIFIEGTTPTQSYFKGDPCFGMWKGIEVDDSLGANTSLVRTTIEDAFVGVRTIVGSYFALGFDDLRINDCIYGLISTRNATAYSIGSTYYQLMINDNPEGLLKPFDYTINSPNRAYDDPANKVFSEFFTKIGFWQTTNTENQMGQISVSQSLVGIRWGDGVSINTTINNYQGYWTTKSCHLMGIHLRVNDNIFLKTNVFIKPLFDGDKVTHQILEILSEFNGEELVVNPLNSSLGRSTNHFGLYSETGGSPVVLNNSYFYDLTAPSQSPFINRPVGIYTKGMTIRGSQFIFNYNYQPPWGTGSEEGVQATAEIIGTAIIVDATGRTNTNPAIINIKNCFFRNCTDVVVFKGGVTLLDDFSCINVNNPKTVLKALNNAQFIGSIGTPGRPAGNVTNWNTAYFGNPNLICSYGVNPNVVTPTNYYKYSDELVPIPLGDIVFPLNYSAPPRTPLTACPN